MLSVLIILAFFRGHGCFCTLFHSNFQSDESHQLFSTRCGPLSVVHLLSFMSIYMLIKKTCLICFQFRWHYFFTLEIGKWWSVVPANIFITFNSHKSSHILHIGCGASWDKFIMLCTNVTNVINNIILFNYYKCSSYLCYHKIINYGNCNQIVHPWCESIKPFNIREYEIMTVVM